MVKKLIIILSALICSSVHIALAHSASISQPQWWVVHYGSPRVSKITVTRHYELDSNEVHPQERTLSAWFAPDSTCLAWSYFWKYEPREYGTNRYGNMKIETDTTQADFLSTPVYNPNIVRHYLNGFDLLHFTSDKEQTDKYGNWTIAYTKEFHHEGDYIERKIEYAGEESTATKAEINKLLDIRDNGKQDPVKALSLTERTRLGIESATVTFVGVMSTILYVIGIISGLLYWHKYKKWQHKYRSFGTENYNTYSPVVWILSAMAMYCLGKGVPGLLVLNTPTIIVAGIFQIAFGAFIYFKVFPGIADMLLYDRAIGRWGSLILLCLNLLSLFSVLCAALTFLTLIGAFIVALLITFFTSIKYFWDQAYKCPNCHCCENTKKLGVFDGGVSSKNSQSENEELELKNPYLYRKTTKSYRTDYYRRDVHLFKCQNCAATWKRTMRGAYLGSKTRKDVIKEKERID